MVTVTNKKVQTTRRAMMARANVYQIMYAGQAQKCLTVTMKTGTIRRILVLVLRGMRIY